MGAEAGAETHEPEISGDVGGRRGAKRFLKREEDGRAAHIAVVAEDAGAGVEGVGCDDGREGVEDVAATWVGDDAADRSWSSSGPKFLHGGSCELRDGTIKEVAELPVAVLETEFVTVFGTVERLKLESAEASGAGGGAPDSGGGTVAEKTGADDDTRVVIQVENGGADFDCDTSNRSVGLRGKDMAGGAERGYRGAAAETDEVLEEGVGAKAEFLGDVAGEAWTEIPGARADQQRVEVCGPQIGLSEGGGQSARGEGGTFGAKDGVQFVGGAVENFLDVGRCKVAGDDSVVAAEDAVEDKAGSLVKTRADGGFFHDIPALTLRESRGWDGGGEGVEEHQNGE